MDVNNFIDDVVTEIADHYIMVCKAEPLYCQMLHVFRQIINRYCDPHLLVNSLIMSPLKWHSALTFIPQLKLVNIQLCTPNASIEEVSYLM